MMKRLIALTAFGAGYVAGAAAGRERYEQIRRTFLKVKNDPTVRQKAHEAAEAVKAETSPIRDKVNETVHDKIADLTGKDGHQSVPDQHDGHHDTATGDLGGGQYEQDPFQTTYR